MSEEKTTFIKVTDKKGTDIVEGWKKPGQTFYIKRFICSVQPQQTEKETQELADELLELLNSK